MANLITAGRIFCSVAMLFWPVYSPVFYALYLIAGLSDMVDGAVARKTNTVSELGSQLDTAADFIFVAVCLIKLLPVMELPLWLWIWIAAVAVIKIGNMIYGFVVQKRFAAVHTVLNKVTGFLLFLLPPTLFVIEVTYSAAVLCAVSSLAAIWEGHIIRTKNQTGRLEHNRTRTESYQRCGKGMRKHQ
ncbi:MAG: CDP-alcohol phosphatidyltransferase family protein [Clostridia bacterium]|nr:CDP-alcohol phosphatidyltransferase family protein [Clostridia bacterium]